MTPRSTEIAESSETAAISGIAEGAGIPESPETAESAGIPEISLRPAREADVATLVELVQAAYRGEGGWTTEAHLVDGYRTDAAEVLAMLADPAVTLMVAASDGGVVGCCYTRRDPADTAGIVRAELGLFAVHPAAQSRGLGSRLLEAQAEHLRAAGVNLLVIQVLQSRPELLAWYERHGFVHTGRSVPFAGDAGLLKVENLGMDLLERPLL